MRTLGLFAITMLLLAAGCRSTDQAEAPQPAAQMLVFSAEQYPAVHAAAVEALRDQGFRIARNDYRYGAITTFPKESATFAEFWVDDATTRDQRRSDTLNSQQRTAEVRVDQSQGEAGYQLRVKVMVQRLQRPERYLTHSATPGLTASYDSVPAHLGQSAIEGPYAQDLHRDAALEARLLQAIRSAVSR